MLKKMWYVYTVYEEKSFSKAAKRLFVSQPSLSAMVKKWRAIMISPFLTEPQRRSR